MEKINLPNGEIELFTPENILYIKFEGDIAEKDYKTIWTTGIDLGVENKYEKFLFDQSSIGKVGFTTRGWVILKMLPRIKNELGKGIKVGVITSKNMVNKTGVNYLVSMFEKMASLNITFYPDIATARAEM